MKKGRIEPNFVVQSLVRKAEKKESMEEENPNAKTIKKETETLFMVMIF